MERYRPALRIEQIARVEKGNPRLLLQDALVRDLHLLAPGSGRRMDQCAHLGPFHQRAGLAPGIFVLGRLVLSFVIPAVGPQVRTHGVEVAHVFMRELLKAQRCTERAWWHQSQIVTGSVPTSGGVGKGADGRQRLYHDPFNRASAGLTEHDMPMLYITDMELRWSHRPVSPALAAPLTHGRHVLSPCPGRAAANAAANLQVHSCCGNWSHRGLASSNAAAIET